MFHLKKIFRHPGMLVTLFVLITLFLGWQIPHLTINNSVESSLSDAHPVKQLKKEMEKVFGESERIMVVLHTPGQSVLTPRRIQQIAEMTKTFEKIDAVAKVDSLVTMDYLTGEADGIRTAPLVSQIPRNDSEMAALKEKINSWELYRGLLFSDDEQSTMMMIELENGRQNARSEAFLTIQKRAQQFVDKDTVVYVAGEEAVTILITHKVKGDIFRLLPFILIILLMILYVAFKNVWGVILPTLTVGMSCIWIVGGMALWGIPFSVMSSAIPILLVAVGSAYGIHLLSYYYDELAERSCQQSVTSEMHQEIVFETLKKIGQPIILAGVTTMAGFGSLATSQITMIRNFGLCTAFGVAMSMIITLVFIPAIMLLRHKTIKQHAGVDQKKSSLLTTMLQGVYHYFTRHQWIMLSLSSVMVILSIWAITQMTLGQPLINYFKKNTDLRKADAFINEHFNGTTVLSVVIEGNVVERPADEEGKLDEAGIAEDDFVLPGAETSSSDSEFEAGDEDFALPDAPTKPVIPKAEPALTRKSIREPALLKKIDGLLPYLQKQFPEVKQVASFAQMIKRMNQVMHADNPDYYEIPTDPAKYDKPDQEALKRLIAQYMLLYSGNLTTFIDNMDNPVKTKLTIQMQQAHPQFIKKVKAAVLAYGKEQIEPLGYTVKTTGAAEIILVVTDYTINTQIKSIIIAMILVFGVVAWYLRSWLAGFFATIPLAISLLINFGIMGFFHIPLDVGTALIASVSIGIGMDYSIHFISGYYRQHQKSDDLEQVNMRTLLTTGKAIVTNALSVAAGFAVLMFSSFTPLMFFGLLVAVTMLTSSFTSMTILPVLLNMFKPKVILR